MESADVYAMVEKARAEGQVKAVKQYSAALKAGNGTAAAKLLDAVMHGDASHAFAGEIAELAPVAPQEWPMVPVRLSQVGAVTQSVSVGI